MLKKTWDKNNTTANVPAAEDDLRLIMLPALMYKDGIDDVDRFLFPICRESDAVP